MRTVIAKCVSALLLAALLVVPSSCLFGASSKVDYKGRHVSTEAMEKVEPGATKSFVMEMFGEPSGKTEPEDGVELWSWRYTKETKKSGGVFLIIGTSSQKTEQGTVYARFRDDKVEKVWRVDA